MVSSSLDTPEQPKKKPIEVENQIGVGFRGEGIIYILKGPCIAEPLTKTFTCLDGMLVG